MRASAITTDNSVTSFLCDRTVIHGNVAIAQTATSNHMTDLVASQVSDTVVTNRVVQDLAQSAVAEAKGLEFLLYLILAVIAGLGMFLWFGLKTVSTVVTKGSKFLITACTIVGGVGAASLVAMKASGTGLFRPAEKCFLGGSPCGEEACEGDDTADPGQIRFSEAPVILSMPVFGTESQRVGLLELALAAVPGATITSPSGKVIPLESPDMKGEPNLAALLPTTPGGLANGWTWIALRRQLGKVIRWETEFFPGDKHEFVFDRPPRDEDWDTPSGLKGSGYAKGVVGECQSKMGRASKWATPLASGLTTAAGAAAVVLAIKAYRKK
jgi:hypothetical protein